MLNPKPIFLLLFSLLFVELSAQKPYFQQEVNTTINCALDDVKHLLNGDIEIEYTNNSPDALKEIYIHLWANAFKNRRTAFAKQKLRTNSTKFYFAKDSTLGNYDQLAFKINGSDVDWNYDAEHPDIAILNLTSPLKPGEKMVIKTDFLLKIPASFSRLGHVGTSYQMTQWYPKPAVYDMDGWHPMPYLDMGEFYSEFGSYEVNITLPKNYVVAATGVLETESEKEFLQRKIEESNEILKGELTDDISFPASALDMKTIRYTAENVHDFAWFADKRFYVQKNQVTLASGKQVDTWAFFTNTEGELWKKGNFYVDRSVKFYSEKVGEYPYPQATAVQSALSAGGGMEYPMITVIGTMGDPQSLDEVITHEVGHNWFYGILAFNERDHAWLDEGINSYYDHRYTREFYGKSERSFLPRFLVGDTDLSVMEMGYLYIARRDVDQAPSTHSNEYSNLINYGIGAYEKPAQVFRYLENYLGTEEYDRIMQSFYKIWEFKHPQPSDLRTYFEKESGKDLGWVFDDLIGSNNKVNYAVKSLKAGDDYKVQVKNKGDIAGPVNLVGIKNNKAVESKWYDGFDGRKTLDFPKGDYDEIVIDPQRLSLDVDRRNNHVKTKGAMKKMEPLRLKFLSGIEDERKTSLYWTPAVAWNNYDKTMFGVALYNSTFFEQPFQFNIVPLYAVTTKSLNGTADLKYNFYPEANWLQQVSVGLNMKRFHHNYNWNFDYYLNYNRISPYVKLQLGRKNTSNLHQAIELRMISVYEEVAEFERVDEETMYTGNKTTNPQVYQLRYSGENRRALHPYNYGISLEQQFFTNSEAERYLKLSGHFESNFTYKSGRNITFRLFGGYFLENTNSNLISVDRRSYSLYSQGFNDYIYDDFYFGRNDNSGFWSHQIGNEEGAMKLPLGSPPALGKSNNFIFALNFQADLPMKMPAWLPLKPYADLGYYDADLDEFNSPFLVSGGLSLQYFNGIFNIYMPLFNSSNIKSNLDDNFAARISFMFDMNKANPWRLVNRMF